MAPRARQRSAQRYIPVTLGPRSPRPCLPWTLSATSGAFTFSLLKQCFGGGQRRLLRRRFRQRLLCGEQVIGPATVGIFLNTSAKHTPKVSAASALGTSLPLHLHTSIASFLPLALSPGRPLPGKSFLQVVWSMSPQGDLR